jgi:homoserine kinase
MATTRLTFKATMAQISVPATSANLGPGFDAFGLALELRDRYAAAVLDEASFDIDVSGEGADEVKKDKNNLVIRAMLHGFEHMGQKPRGIALRALNVTPHGRGLGSSSSAIVGGLALSRALVHGGENFMSDDEMVALATELEGHPDNVAAAVRGGATIAWLENGIGKAVNTEVNEAIKATVFVPPSTLSTSKARKILPEMVPQADAAINAGRAALLIHALSLRPDLLFTATEDRIHQSYRESAMPKSLDLVQRLRSAGVAAVISGAGPSVLVLHTLSGTEEHEMIAAAGSGFAAQSLEISRKGYMQA